MKKILIILLAFIFITSGLVLPGQRTIKRAMTPTLKIKLKLQLKEISEKIRITKKLDPGTLNQWKQVLQNMHSSGIPVDINALIQNILKDSYKENTEDLTFYANKVKYFNKVKSDMRKYIQEIRSTRRQAKLKPGPGKITLKLKDFSPAVKFSRKFNKPAEFKKPGNLIRSKKLKFLPPRINFFSKNVVVTPKDLEDEIKKMEDKMKDTGDDAALANIDLQNALQKQQQLIQMMSNISKVLHDAAMAVIRKI